LKTAILGAGISGLALARFLIEGGFHADDLHLFEAASKPGGLCASKKIDGFTYDVAGGHILFSRDQEVVTWMKQRGGGEESFDRRERETKIRFGDRWVHYPFENGLGDLPAQESFECLDGYVQAWHERKASGSAAPPDFARWIRWRFGEGIAAHFMNPYNEKIWKRDLRELSSGWVADRVPDAPIEDVLRSAVGLRTEGYTHQSIFHYPKAGGFQAITDGLASEIESRIRLSTPVEDLVRGESGWKVNGEEFDQVISTVPLTALPGIIDGLPGEVAEAMRGLEYNSLVTFLVALDRPEHPPLSWIYLPHASQGPANRVTYLSNYSEGCAPAGKTSLLCEVTYDGAARSPGKELEKQVTDGLVEAGLIRREEILFVDRSEVSHAYIVYGHRHEERRAAALSWLEENGIIPLGRFGRFEYDNSDLCTIKARALAEKLLATNSR
jgi:protoporphyrinogen oxidase